VILAILIPLLVVGIGWLLYDARSGDGSRTSAACSLLSQAQVDAYVPDAVPGGDGDAYSCRWSDPAGAGGETGRLTVAVATSPGERPRVEDAEEVYELQRRQAGESGTTVTPLPLGDESFMVCGTSRQGAPASCTTYTRVENVVFSLEFESSPATGAPEPASTVRALAALAVQHLEEPS
jgi:hypothetical protein